MDYELKEYFCIYLDILGYTKRIENLYKHELENELNNFINYVVNENEFLNELSRIIQFHIKLFSDNILIALPVTNETLNDFHLILSHIIDYQKNLILSNYFIRGGISKGLLYIDENTIWGPALIDVVKIEKSTKYPFIGISDDILKLFVEKDLLSNENEYLSIPIIEIIDGKYFLDYLQTTIYIKNNLPTTYYAFLPDHKRLIEYNLKIYMEENILDKYVLLAKYHNEFCDIYKEKLPPVKHYLINNYFNKNIIYKRKYLKILLSD